MSSKKSGKPQRQEILALGARIRMARERKDKSQEWLAGVLGVDKARISEWERGRHQPGSMALRQISDATGCDLAWLLRGDEQNREARAGAHGAEVTYLKEHRRRKYDALPGTDHLVDQVLRSPGSVPWLVGLLDILQAGNQEAEVGVKANINAFLGMLQREKVAPAIPLRKRRGRRHSER